MPAMKPGPHMQQSPRGTGLLVSVRSLQELRAIAELNVDVLDFKEPQQGPLAPADPAIWRQAAAQMPERCRLSAALGECGDAAELASRVPPRFAYAKAGPSASKTIARLVAPWAAIRSQLAGSVELVAVAYADHDKAQCAPPEAIFQAAARAGMRTWLVDTFDKTGGGNAATHLGAERLRDIERSARRCGASWVLAGSITSQTAEELLRQGIRPTFFGVRGDVCDGSRGGRVVAAKVSAWLELLRLSAQDVNHGDDRKCAQSQA